MSKDFFVDIEVYDTSDPTETWAQGKYLAHGVVDVLWTDDLSAALEFLREQVTYGGYAPDKKTCSHSISKPREEKISDLRVIAYTKREGQVWRKTNIKIREDKDSLIDENFITFCENYGFHSIRLADGREYDVLNGLRKYTTYTEPAKTPTVEISLEDLNTIFNTLRNDGHALLVASLRSGYKEAISKTEGEDVVHTPNEADIFLEKNLTETRHLQKLCHDNAKELSTIKDTISQLQSKVEQILPTLT